MVRSIVQHIHSISFELEAIHFNCTTNYNTVGSVPCLCVRMQVHCCCYYYYCHFVLFCFVPSSSELFSLLIWMTLISFWMSPKIWINGHVKHHKRMFDNTLMDKFYKHINYTIYMISLSRSRSLSPYVSYDAVVFGFVLCEARLSHFILFAYKRFIMQRLLQVLLWYFTQQLFFH